MPSRLAIETYAELASVASLGPFGWIEDSTAERLRVIQPAIDRLLTEVVPTTDRAYWAPSPWHAAVFCRTVVEHLAWLHPPEEPPAVAPGQLLVLPPTGVQRPIFRGHADADWLHNLTPRLSRAGWKERSAGRRTSLSFSVALEHLAAHLDLRCPSSVWADALAQHYGLATQLLDFTVDPDVAVAFGSAGEQRRRDQAAIVFVLPTGSASRIGMEVSLPPPFARRLHLQKGLFVRARSRRRVRQLRVTCLRLRFPLDPEFSVIREGVVLTRDDLLPEDDWFTNAIAVCREVRHPRERGNLDCAVLKCSTLLSPRLTAGEVEWLQFLDEMIFWLGVRLSSKQEGWAIDPHLLQKIVSSNQCAIEALIDRNESFAAEADSVGNTQEVRDRRSWNALLKSAARGDLMQLSTGSLE